MLALKKDRKIPLNFDSAIKDNNEIQVLSLELFSCRVGVSYVVSFNSKLWQRHRHISLCTWYTPTFTLFF